MSLETNNELEGFFRSMRQACNSCDIKAYRSHFWTDQRFVHLDASGRTDIGWGAYEEVLDQEFRYLDTFRMELVDLHFQVFEDRFASVSGNYRLTQVDPEGREASHRGRVSFSVAKIKDGWKIVSQHFSEDRNGEAE
jgi:ketosteroid isomerase-like protein